MYSLALSLSDLYHKYKIIKLYLIFLKHNIIFAKAMQQDPINKSSAPWWMTFFCIIPYSYVIICVKLLTLIVT